MNFEVGDKVRCINTDGVLKLIKNKIYEVSEKNRWYNDAIFLKEIPNDSYYNWHFELELRETFYK